MNEIQGSTETRIVDIKVPFLSIVILTFKMMLAIIPAGIMIAMMFAAFSSILSMPVRF